MATYTELKAVDTKAALVKQLIQATSARLSHEVIQSVLNWVSESDEFEGFGLASISDLDIKVLGARDFGNALRLQDYKMEHSWAGDDKTKEFGFLVFGDAKFGLAKNHSYYNNGNYAGGDESVIDGDFSIDQIQMVLVNQIISDHFNNNCIDENNWKLLIYIPEENLLDAETYELGRRFGFLGKFA